MPFITTMSSIVVAPVPSVGSLSTVTTLNLCLVSYIPFVKFKFAQLPSPSFNLNSLPVIESLNNVIMVLDELTTSAVVTDAFTFGKLAFESMAVATLYRFDSAEKLKLTATGDPGKLSVT